MIQPRGGGDGIPTVHSRCIDASLPQPSRSCHEAALSSRPYGVDTMRTVTTLVMITLLGLGFAQANATAAPGSGSLTGVPMSAAKRLLNTTESSVEPTDAQLTGVPMARATRLLGPQFATSSAGAGATAVPLSGVPMVRAKRP